MSKLAMCSRNSLLTALLLVLVQGCAVSPPEGIEAVRGFEMERYLGRWYEIARLDHRFERGLSRVTAEYSLNEDGSVKVVNRGYLERRVRWTEREGTARLVEGPDVGLLEVTFFPPIRGAYVIFELDEDYEYAMVSGPSRSYLWLLSRSAEVDDALITHFYTRARELGFDSDEIILVDQTVP